MLASITPLGERGRQAHWALTVSMFLLGAGAASVGAGALIGCAGAIVLPASVDGETRLAVLAVAVLVALALDAGAAAGRIPGPRRQVNERWLDQYRGWVYGLGYGAQLGLGVTTVVTSAATYAALVAAFLSGSVAGGALIVGCYGAVRGLTPLAAARVRSPRQLIALHATLAHWRRRATQLGVGGLGALLALALAGSLT